MKDKEEDREIGTRIKQLRKRLGISQDEFSIRIGLKQRTLSYIENGDRGILCSVVKAMHKEFGANPEWIILGNGGMFQNKSEAFL